MPDLTVHGQKIRYDVRPGDGDRTPLLLCCGIGASFEVLQPLVDALDPDLEVIRFDVPGVGGSPVGPVPYPFPALAWLVTRMLDRLGLRKMLTPRRFADPEYAAGVAAFLYGGSARRHAGDIRTMFRAQQHAGSRRGYLYQLAAGAGWTSLPFLGLIRQPTLVMGGDDDPIVPLANARIMAGLIPRATLHVFHGGHVELVTEAPALAPVITEFLARGGTS